MYGTLEHGTPLLELSVDRVTAEEREAFEEFQRDYMRLWQKFFDPVGIRFGLEPGKTKVEVFILPLIASREYSFLRGITSEGRAPEKHLLRVPERVPVETVFQLLLRLGPAVKEIVPGLGDWLLVHLGGDVFREDLVRAAIRVEVDPARAVGDLDSPLASLTFGVEVKDLKQLNEAIPGMDGEDFWSRPSPGRTYRRHRGVKYAMAPSTEESSDIVTQYIHSIVPVLKDLPRGVLRPKNLYTTKVRDGHYISLDAANMRRRIDFALLKEKPGDGEGVHAALHFAPPGGKGGKALAAYIDWRTHVKTQAALAHWEGFYAGGLIPSGMKPVARDNAVRRLLGYVPVSGDGTALTWRAKEGRMVNEHHGTLAAPTFRGKLPADAPLANLLRTLRSVNAGLRFREDGLHTTITLDWSGRE